MTSDMLTDHEYLADYLLINILDQIWIQEFYQPCIEEVTLAYESEIKKCHRVGGFEELMCKKQELQKLYKLMRRIELNQSSKAKYVELLSNKVTEVENHVCDVEKTIKDSISGLLNDTCQKTKDLSEFCQEVKMY